MSQNIQDNGPNNFRPSSVVPRPESRVPHPGLIGLWWRAVRPFAYPASVVPALLGVVLAWSQYHHIDIGIAILTIIGACAAHTGANLMNDYVDFRRGVDREGTLGGSGVLVEGILKPRAIFIASAIAFAVALAAAVPLYLRVGPALALLVLGGFIAGAGYVLPPLGFKYRAMGDVIVFAAFGIGITLGSYMAQMRTFSWVPVLCAIPVGMLVAAILHSNNMRDMKDDCESSVKTVAGMIGLRASKTYYTALIIGAYALIAFFALIEKIPAGAVAALVTLPLAMRLVSRVSRTPLATREAMLLVDAETAKLNLAFGLALVVGIVGWTAFVK